MMGVWRDARMPETDNSGVGVATTHLLSDELRQTKRTDSLKDKHTLGRPAESVDKRDKKVK